MRDESKFNSCEPNFPHHLTHVYIQFIYLDYFIRKIGGDPDDNLINKKNKKQVGYF